MELAEPIEEINKHLKDEFGYHDYTRPYWRVVWSEDQFEKRFGNFRDFVDGLFVREVNEVREVPKYSQWIKNKWVLERLTIVPVPNLVELLGEQLSYEPVWVFEGKHGDYQAPTYRAAKFVIHTVYQQAARVVGAKYKDPESTKEESEAAREARIKALEADLFGNETKEGDALAQDHAVGYGVRKRNDGV